MKHAKAAQLIEETSAVLAKLVLPIDWSDRGRPVQTGTGFFVRSGTDHFFVSAAHVLDELRERELFFFVAPGSIRRLSGRALLTPSHGNRSNDLIDVGVLKFSGKGTPPYTEVQRFAIDISYLRPNVIPRTGCEYMIVGYPASRGHVNPVAREASSRICSYRAWSVEDEIYSAHDLDPRIHLALPLDLKRGRDIHGNARIFPKPNGMSGSPIWLLDGAGEEQMFRVIAIGTTYWKAQRLLIGTDVSVILKMIAELSNGRLQSSATGTDMSRRG